MLRIEKVYLQGFKSFCDPTEVVFDAEGITAVVGPNGCGKSNVADALSWVIGEQRAKALRGGKMEDVIFQGSRNRAASGLAEVILTLRVSESFALRSSDQPGTVASDPPPIDEPALEITTTAPSPSIALKTPPRTYAEGEKITIARRLYRTGESEYEMNGRTCRLRDIQELFAGTGLGAAHYAIIEQGRIGQVLSAKPLDRRTLIEEAAGISKFKMRQRAAEVKLEAARQNLSRVTDIISEVERQQGALKRQAAKARRFQRLRSELRTLLQFVFISEYRQSQQLLQQLAGQREEISQQEATLLQAIQYTEEQRQNTVAQADQQQATLTTARATAAATYLQIEKERQQQQYLQAQLQTLAQHTQQATQDQEIIRARNTLLQQEAERLAAVLAALEAEINGQALELSQAEQAHAEQAVQEQLTEKQLDTMQRSVTEAATHQERWDQLVRQFTEAEERIQKTLLGLLAEEERTARQAERIAQERTATQEQLTQLAAEQQELLTQLAVARQALARQQEIVKVQEQTLQSQQKQHLALEQRLKSLLELDDRRAYFSETVQALIRASENSSNVNGFNIIGTLADFIKVTPKDEAMVEAGLREELQYLLTPSFDDALRAIDFLKREKHGRATFLVLQAMPHSAVYKGNGGGTDAGTEITRLIDVLGLKPELRQIIQQALPRLSQTVVTPHLQQAIAASVSTNGKGHSFLTATGEFVSAGHIISGGGTSQQATGILALKREIEELQQQNHQLSATLQKSEEEVQTSQQEVSHWLARNQQLETQQRELEKAIFQEQGTLSQHERDEERMLTHWRIVQAEIEQANTEQHEVAGKRQHAQEQLAQAKQSRAAAENRASATSEVIAEIRQKATVRIQELSSRRADFAAKSERRKGLQHDLRRLGNESEDIARRLARLQMETDEATTQAQTLQTSLATGEETLLELLAQHQAQTSAVTADEAALAQQRDRLLELESSLTQVRTSLQEEREQRATLDIERTKLISHLEHLAANCYAELGEPLADLLAREPQGIPAEQETQERGEVSRETREEAETTESENEEEADFQTTSSQPLSFTRLPDDFDLAQGKTYLAELRAKIESLGPVNLLALQEIGEQEDRLAFLLTQKADIEQAVTDTLAVIAELKRRSQDRFRTAFQQINQNFSEMFLELFGGGHGEMRLIDESDVLESGIDIIAQPPGKRLQNVLLLSGGEKAMAALALVMGIFKFRPSPFCLLDEVDAPLDDVNIGRFADKVLEMSQHTQFVVITHSKRTMEAARTLYGVTMEDPGISKLISVRLT